MSFYMVFCGERHPIYPNRSQLKWEPEPVGVFRAESPEDACKLAARKTQTMASYFAIEGYAWGVELMEVDGASEFGAANDPMLRAVAALERRGEQLERAITMALDRGNDNG